MNSVHTIESIALRRLNLPLKFVFRTAKATVTYRQILLVEVRETDGVVGYGECVAFTDPFYTSETLDSAWTTLEKYYIPDVLAHQSLTAKGLIERCFNFPGNIPYSPMAMSAIENALLHIECERLGVNTVSHVMNCSLDATIPNGVVIGDIPMDQLLDSVQNYVDHGCKRIKLKVSPVDGLKRTTLVRHAFPELPLTIDGNGSFPFEDLETVHQFDELNLLCLEEIFHMSSIENYGMMVKELKDKGQWSIKTPICLDESILTTADLQYAIHHNCIDVLNLKIGRFGGLYHTKMMRYMCNTHGIRYWVGSMVESSISKMMHVQLAATGNMLMPGDLSDSARYFDGDLTTPDLVFSQGIMTVPTGPGLGVTVDDSLVHAYTVESKVFKPT